MQLKPTVKNICLASLLILFLGSIVSIALATTNTIITKETFERGFSSYWYRAMNQYSYSGKLSTNYSVSPAQSYRFELRNTDPVVNGGKRSELAGRPEPPLKERIYGFSIYLPKGGAEDYTADNYHCSETIVQWHNNPDPGEAWTMPSLELMTGTNSSGTGHYYLQSLWDNDPISTNAKMIAEGKVHEYDLGSYEGDKGKWVNWMFHVKWGWLKSQNPKLEVYKNGVMVLNLDGIPNTTNDIKGVNQQFGIYKWEWSGNYPNLKSKLTKRVIYFDDVSVTEVNNN